MSMHPMIFLLVAAVLASRPGPAATPEGGYHGGALLVTDPASARGHLVPGQVLPIRLSRLAPAGPTPPREGAELAGSVRYGQLEFLAVAPGSVTFRTAFRDAAGALGPAVTRTLQVGDSADLDGDGRPDLALDYPAAPLTVDAAAVDYALLSFRCGPEGTATFALDPGAFPGGRYPYGISGVTPGGRFIFQSDCLPPATLGRALPVLPGPGDVLVDTASGRFGRIERITRTDGRWSVQFAPPRSPFLFTQVFGAAYVHVSGDLGELVRRYRPGAPAGDAGGTVDLLDLHVDQVLMDNRYGRVDLALAARVALTLDLTATLDYHGAAIALDARLEPALRLAVTGRAAQAWTRDFGPWTVAAPSVGFAVGGIPLVVSLPVTAGLAMDWRGTGALFEGISTRGGWSWSGALGASWGWQGVQVNAPAPQARSTVVCLGLPGNRAQVDGQGSLRPWLEVAPTLAVAAILTGSSPARLALDGSYAGAGGGGHAQLEAQARLAARFSLDVPLLGEAWTRSWPLCDWTGTVWSGNWAQRSRSQSPLR